YVPLDPAYPVERSRYMLKDSGAMVLLTQKHLEEWDQELGIPVVELGDKDWKSQSHVNVNARSIGLTSGHVAYVIYTSGSTGTPKGVMVQHQSLVNYLSAVSKVLPKRQLNSIISSPISFDLINTSLYPPLIQGGYLLLLPSAESDIEELARRLDAAHPDWLVKLTPSHLQAL